MSARTNRTDGAVAAALIELYVTIQHIYSRTSRDVGLTPQQAHLMCVVQHRSPALGELAAELGCDKTNITGLVDRIVQRGLIERVADDHDRRITRVRVTGSGRQLIQRFDRDLYHRLDDLDPSIEITPAMIVAVAAHLRDSSTD